MTAASSNAPVFPDDVDVAVVSHDGRATLPRLLECLGAAAAPVDRITVYDIGSTDGTAEWLAAEWPGVALQSIEGNVGPNPARNRALREAKRPVVLLLDADAYLRPDAPTLLRQALDTSARVGMVAPVVVQADRPEWIQYAGVDLHFICEAVNPWVNRRLSERGTDRRDLGSAPGVALLIDVAAAQAINLWDERYFMGKDDGDFCYRLRLAGYRLLEEPRAIVDHGNRPRSAWMFAYQIRNRWYFLLKNYRTGTLVVLLPALAIHEVLQFLLLAAKGHLGAWWRALRDIVRWIPEIGPARRTVQDTRTVGDGQLLVSAPLLVRDDLAGGRIAGTMKRAYDAWLHAYWVVARRVIS